MKQIWTLCLLVVMGSCSQQPTNQKNEESKADLIREDSLAIMDNFKNQENCWNHHDLECYVQAYRNSDEVQTISRNGVTKGYDDILRDYKNYFPEDRMGKLHFDQIHLRRLSDQYYYAIGRFNLNYEGQEKVLQGWFSVLMQKIDGTWYMVSDHSS